MNMALQVNGRLRFQPLHQLPCSPSVATEVVTPPLIIAEVSAIRFRPFPPFLIKRFRTATVW